VLAPLYLDTARLGQMSPRACRASVDFARFASEHGCSLYLSQLLHDGFSSWPEALQECYSGLADWQGVTALADQFKKLANATPGSDLVIAARSAELMRFAAKLLIGPCRNVLVTDLSWPAYEKILAEERRGAECRCTRLEVRQAILRQGMTTAELIDRLASTFVCNRCDGLFLPLVDNLGVRLPIRAIVNRIRQEAELRFTIVDGAQSIGHVPLDLEDGYCDLFLAGCHKWLRAFSPLGLAFFGQPGSTTYIRDSLRRWTDNGDLDDPLLAFSRELSTTFKCQRQSFGETVNIVPLFTASGAVQDALAQQCWSCSADSRQDVIGVACDNGWKPISPEQGFTSRIMLFEPRNGPCESSPEAIKSAFLAGGVALSAYDNGLIRLSLPRSKLGTPDLSSLESGFAVAGRILSHSSHAIL